MTHVFSFFSGGRYAYFMFESENNGLLSIERPVFLLVKKKRGVLTEAEELEYLELSRDTVAEIESELNELRQEGIIDVADSSVTAKKTGEIKSLCLNVCHDCNLRCQYCFAGQGRYGETKEERSLKYMSLDTARAAVDFLIEKSGKRKNLEIDFFGGEPLMNFDTVKMTVEYARTKCREAGKNIDFTMTTNGLLLDEDASKWLDENMENVVISIDGRAATHDAVRKTASGNASFERVLKNALSFRKIRGDRRYYIRGTYTAKNIDFGEDILFLNDCGFDQISMEPVVLDAKHELCITPELLEKVLEEYQRFAEKYLERRKNGRYFNFFHFMIDLERGPCVYKRLNGCGAGDEYIAITPKGDIYPCHQFIGREEFGMGNVVDEEFKKDIQKKFQQSNIHTKDGCNTCFAKYFCGGGCAANSFGLEGSIDKTNATYCAMMKRRLELSLALKGIEEYC